MKKVIVYIATSLDGYIARKNGDISWLGGDNPDINDIDSYNNFYNSIDTVILGYKTYHQVINELAVDNWPYEGKKSYVFTSKQDIVSSNENIIITNDNLIEKIKELKEENGKDIWICGGAAIVNELLDNNLIDVLTISVIPTILGDGISLFNKKDKLTKLSLSKVINYNGIVESTYIINKEKTE